MKFGVGVDYSLKALLMLAERYPSTQPLQVEAIATAQNIPENYLRRLLISLKRGGLVLSQKGPSGGYILARPPSRITMADVVEIDRGRLRPGGMPGGRRQFTLPPRPSLCDARRLAPGP